MCHNGTPAALRLTKRPAAVKVNGRRVKVNGLMARVKVNGAAVKVNGPPAAVKVNGAGGRR
jgi:sulfur carrier protein ThiS